MTTNDLQSKLSATKTSARKTATAAADLAREAARTVKDQTVDLASDAAATARDAAADRIDSARLTLADSGDRLAKTLHDSADVAGSVGARALAGAANGLSGAARSLRDHSLNDLVGSARDFARRNPGAFVAGAAVAGFALARFLRSSARDRAAEHRARQETERVYRDAARHSVDRLGNTDGARS